MDAKSKTILVVDDDEGMRDTLSAILKKDCRVRVAPTGEEGLSILKKEPVDLVLLDVRLPGIGGLDVLKIARENYDLVEIIMVSAVTEIEVAVQAMKHGAYHYITKEFDYDGLRSLVRNALQRQDLSRQIPAGGHQPPTARPASRPGRELDPRPGILGRSRPAVTGCGRPNPSVGLDGHRRAADNRGIRAG